MNLAAVRHEFVCPCGYQHPVTVPAKIALASWLADYSCPDCGHAVYPRVDYHRPSEEEVLDRAVGSVLSALAEPGVSTVADIAQQVRLSPNALRQALVRLRAVGFVIAGGDDHGADDAAADIEFRDVAPDCPGCGMAGSGPGFCAGCSTRAGGVR